MTGIGFEPLGRILNESGLNSAAFGFSLLLNFDFGRLLLSILLLLSAAPLLDCVEASDFGDVGMLSPPVFSVVAALLLLTLALAWLLPSPAFAATTSSSPSTFDLLSLPFSDAVSFAILTAALSFTLAVLSSTRFWLFSPISLLFFGLVSFCSVWGFTLTFPFAEAAGLFPLGCWDGGLDTDVTAAVFPELKFFRMDPLRDSYSDLNFLNPSVSFSRFSIMDCISFFALYPWNSIKTSGPRFGVSVSRLRMAVVSAFPGEFRVSVGDVRTPNGFRRNECMLS